MSQSEKRNYHNRDVPCLYPPCLEPSKNRGLCYTHYNKGRVAIKNGLVTIEQYGRKLFPKDWCKKKGLVLANYYELNARWKLNKELLKIAKDSRKLSHDRQSFGKCLFPPCKERKVGRGLCKRHHARARNLIIDGITTWEELEEKHRALPTIRNDYVQFYMWLAGVEDPKGGWKDTETGPLEARRQEFRLAKERREIELKAIDDFLGG